MSLKYLAIFFDSRPPMGFWPAVYRTRNRGFAFDCGYLYIRIGRL